VVYKLRALLALLFVLLAAPPARAAEHQNVAYLGHLPLPPGQVEVVVSGTRAYLLETDPDRSYEGGLLRVLDVADPARPREVGRMEFGQGAFGTGLALAGTYLYVTVDPSIYAIGQVRVIDVSDPANPRQVGSADTTNQSPRRPFIAEGRLYTLSQYWKGFQGVLDVFDLSDPVNPMRRGSLSVSTYASGLRDVAVTGTRAYVADVFGGLRILDVSDPANPRQIGVYSTSAFAVLIDGARLHVAVGSALHVIDPTDPAAPRLLGTLELGGTGLPRLAREGAMVYAVVPQASGVPTQLRVVDVTDPARPTTVATASTADEGVITGQAAGLAVAGGRVYQPDPAGALWVFEAPVSRHVGPTELRPRAYLPVVLERAGLPLPGASDMTTSVSVRNHATVPARVALWLLDANGAHVTTPLSYQIDAGGDLHVYLPQHNLPARPYTVVVAADEAVSAQANLAGQGTASTSYAGIAATGGRTTLHAPGVYRRYVGTYSSLLTLHNPGTRAARATVTYRDVEGAVAAAQEYSVPPNGTIYLSQDLGPLPDGFLGAATITADTPLLGVVNVGSPGGELGATALHSPTSVSSGAALPSLYKRYSTDDWISSLIVQNVEARAAEVTVTFRPIASTTEAHTLTDTIPPYGVRQYWLGAVPSGLPDGFAGSALVQSAGGVRVLAVANTRDDRGNFSTYSSVPYGAISNQLHLPALYSGYSPAGWSSSFTLQNTSHVPREVDVLYYSGATLVRQYTIALGGHETRLMYQPSEREALPAGFRGSVVLRPGAYVAAVANVVATGSGGDRLLTYEAVAVGG
jgi:hypothetical protein